MAFLRDDFRLEQASCKVESVPRYKILIPAEEDLSELMPYLNAVARVVFYDPEEPVIVFRLDEKKVALRPFLAQLAEVGNIEEGRLWREKLEKYLEEVWARREEISPRHQPRTLPPALEIYKLLPQTNCGQCGEATCLAFAAKLSTGEADLSACPVLKEEKFAEAGKKLSALLEG
ncbi:MAG: hypothetical protein GXO17_05655 [Thermodesulfobacteria bacterium]|nr:hypothetical protein [Thermodesulfobacteriota bacterium]